MLTDFMNEYIVLSKKTEIALERAEMIHSLARKEALIMYDKSDLKVIKENGTESDLRYLYEAVEEGFVAKVKKALQSIIQSIQEFFKNLLDKVTRTFVKGDVTKKLDEIEKKVKKNPKLRNKKVEIDDYDKKGRVVKEHQSALKKMLSKIKSGQSVDREEIEEENGKFNKALAAVSAAVVVTTVGALIAVAKKTQNDLANSAVAESEDASRILAQSMSSLSEDTDPEIVANLTLVANGIATSAKSLADIIFSKLVGIMSALTKACRSTDATGDLIIEATGIDFKAIYEAATGEEGEEESKEDESDDDESDDDSDDKDNEEKDDEDGDKSDDDSDDDDDEEPELSDKAKSVFDDFMDLDKKDQKSFYDAIDDDDDEEPKFSGKMKSLYDDYQDLSKKDREDFDDVIDDEMTESVFDSLYSDDDDDDYFNSLFD